MNKNLIVEIFVPIVDTTIGNKGTGYPVAPGLIITAAHVLFHERRDRSKPIEVRWYHQHGSAAHWRPAESVAWDGRPMMYDAALIRCTFPADALGYGRLSERKPGDGHPWASEGFAAAGARDDKTSYPVPMIGETHSAADQASTFQLGVSYSISLDRGWKGASGSPVFLGDEIIGIISTCPPNFEQRRLHATPTWKLLQIPDFRGLVLPSLQPGSPLPNGSNCRVPLTQYQTLLLKQEVQQLANIADALAQDRDSSTERAEEFLAWKKRVSKIMQSDAIYRVQADKGRMGKGLYGVLRNEMKRCRDYLENEIH